MKRALAGLTLLAALAAAAPAEAQYAVGHRRFGGGTSFGGGYSRADYDFPKKGDTDPNKPYYWLLPTLEFKLFLADTFSIDLSVPVTNIATSNALQKYFYFTAEIFADFHPSAPHSSVELFVAPGFGVSYAAWKDPDNSAITASGYAFHIPVRAGLEFNNARRTFSFTIAIRPFFSLVHGGTGDNGPGGGAFLELGLNAYAVGYQADRY
jgi:hypothetical protein